MPMARRSQRNSPRKEKKKNIKNNKEGLPDLISGLPEDIIQNILNLLPLEYACITSIVSKRFRTSWRSYCLCIFQPCRSLADCDSSVPNDRLWFLDRACRSIQNMEADHVKMQNFMMRVDLGHQEADDRINKLVQFGFDNCLMDLYLNLSPANYSLQNVVSRTPKSLTSLELNGFSLDLQDLLRSCSLLQDLTLFSCDLRHVDVRISSAKLKRLNMGSLRTDFKVCSIQIEAPNLQVLKFKNDRMSNVEELKIAACKSLRKLALSFCNADNWLEEVIPQLVLLERITLDRVSTSRRLNLSSSSLCSLKLRMTQNVDINAPNLGFVRLCGADGPVGSVNPPSCKLITSLLLWSLEFDSTWLQGILAESPLLQTLKLEYCTRRESVKISHPRLANLHLYECEWDEMAIDAPQLRNFYYSGDPYPFSYFNYPSSLSATLRLFSSYQKDDLFPLKLWQFSRVFFRCKALTLYKDDLMDLRFAQGKNDVPIQSVDVRVKTCMFLRQLEVTSIVEDVLQLCCHPQTITIIPFDFQSLDPEDEKGRSEDEKCKKFVYDETMFKKHDASCNRTHSVRCWRQYLRGVTLVNFPGKQRRLQECFRGKARVLKPSIRLL